MKKNILKFSLLTLFTLFNVITLFAQDPTGDGTDEDDYSDPAPIDNWMMILILAGILLGTYFLFKYKRKVIA